MSTTAVIIPGFSETVRFAEGLGHALCSGPNAFATDVSIVPLGDALSEPDKYDRLFAQHRVFTHSAGVLAVNAAKEIYALNAPEPTRLSATIRGALKIAFDKDTGNEDGIETGNLVEPLIEVARHLRQNIRVPFRIREFSSAVYLAQSAERFPLGRYLFQTDQDQFGFTRQPAIDYANSRGVFAAILHGKHNHAMFQPKDMVEQMTQALASR